MAKSGSDLTVEKPQKSERKVKKQDPRVQNKTVFFFGAVLAMCITVSRWLITWFLLNGIFIWD